MSDTITMTPDDLKELKRLYEECEGDSFTFKGRKILKAYAKYMIEYLEGEFK